MLDLDFAHQDLDFRKELNTQPNNKVNLLMFILLFYFFIFSNRWSKGGVPIPEAKGDSLEVTVDYSYFTDPVSCEVSNSVGSTNVSTLVDVQCMYIHNKRLLI